MGSGSRIWLPSLRYTLPALGRPNVRAVRLSARRSYAAVPEYVSRPKSMPPAGMGPFISDRLQAVAPVAITRRELQEVEIPNRAVGVDFSLYSERHKFPGYIHMRKLFQQGIILEAMTRFYLASKQWELVKQGEMSKGEADFEITPHIVDDLMHTLSRLATMPDKCWTDFRQKTSRSSYWIPPNLGKDVDVRTMKVPDLCLHAICSVYDIAGSLGISPSPASMVSIIHALSKHVDEDTFTKCVTMLLLRLSGSSYQDSVMTALSSTSFPLEQFDFPSFSSEVMRSIVEGYGRLGSPHVGEEMVQRWSLAGMKGDVQQIENQAEANTAWRLATDGRQKSLLTPVWIDSIKWRHDKTIWTALIRSRAFSNDLAGARHWFHRYRQEGLALIRSSSQEYCGLPHIEYLLACTRVRREQIDWKQEEETTEPDRWIEMGKSRFDAVQDVIKLMYSDGAPLSSTVFSLLINFHLGHGKIREATDMIIAFLKCEEAKSAWPANFYKSLFHLHRLLYIRESHSAALQLTGLVTEQRGGKTLALGDLRTLYKDLISQPGFRASRWTLKAKVETLETALQASLAADDYPLVATILKKFQQEGMPINEDVQSKIISFMFPSKFKEAQKQESRNRHSWKVHRNMRTLMQENTPEGEIQRIILTRKYDPAERREVDEDARRFIKYAETKIINRLRKVMRRNGPLRETDAKWIHEAYPTFKGRDFHGKDSEGKDLVSNGELLQEVLSPFQS